MIKIAEPARQKSGADVSIRLLHTRGLYGAVQTIYHRDSHHSLLCLISGQDFQLRCEYLPDC